MTWVYDPIIYLNVEPTQQVFPLVVSIDSETYTMGVDTKIEVNGDLPHYAGGYVFTPTENEQVVFVGDKICDENIIINPIPTNYGLITWDGTKITVS